MHKDQLWLVMQLMNKGSCLHVMNLLKKKGAGEGLKEEFVAVILNEALKGLQYFHENGQIHRDIKAGNILLDNQGHVVIADFGVSGWMMEGGDRRKNRQTFVGTPCWMAPEVMEQVRGYDYKADIWSLGITALELAKGYAPYARFQPMKVLLLTLQEDPPSLRTYDVRVAWMDLCCAVWRMHLLIRVCGQQDDGSGHQFSRHFKDVVKVCLQKDPTKRCVSLPSLLRIARMSATLIATRFSAALAHRRCSSTTFSRRRATRRTLLRTCCRRSKTLARAR